MAKKSVLELSKKERKEREREEEIERERKRETEGTILIKKSLIVFLLLLNAVKRISHA
jgi:hypothetical protein